MAGTTKPIPANQVRNEEVYAVCHGLYGSLQESMHALTNVAATERA